MSQLVDGIGQLFEIGVIRRRRQERVTRLTDERAAVPLHRVQVTRLYGDHVVCADLYGNETFVTVVGRGELENLKTRRV